jgi:hypothetical protein
MPNLHIANTSFEWELAQSHIPSLLSAMQQHPIYLQLQFLPFLYADSKDGVLVTHQPPDEFWEALSKLKIKPAKLHLLSDPGELPYKQVLSWGASRSVAAWSKTHKLPYASPSWDAICQSNSKEFSFLQSPQLPGSTLLRSQEQADIWIKEQKEAAVLKTCFGVSGKGHFFIDPLHPSPSRITSFLQREWKEGRPVVAEPWVSRMIDFSTQWEISKKGTLDYVGVTICENDAKGRYRHNRVGNEISFFGIYYHYLTEHKIAAKKILKKLSRLGFCGHVGIDAMIYQIHTIPNEMRLHPIVEVNARKTMGWVALQVQQKHFPHLQLSLNYIQANEVDQGMLPSYLIAPDGSKITFTKQLTFGL